MVGLLRRLAWLLALGVAPGASREAPSVVVVVTCSAHYTDLFENWLAWLARLGLLDEVGLVAIAEDGVAYDYLAAWAAAGPPGSWRRAVRSDFAGASGAPLAGELGFETPGFARLMARRAAYLASQLEALRRLPTWAADLDGSRLVFSDLDVVWLADPRPFLAGEGCDAWAQTQHRERKLLNPGFLALRPTPGAHALLSDWAKRLAAAPPQRNLPVFNDAVRGLLGAAKTCALPPETFASAKRTFNRPRWSAKSPRGVVTAHANWIDGHDAKKAALVRADAWLAPPAARPLLAPPR